MANKEKRTIDPLVQAKALIQEEEAKKAQACLNEINAILDKYGYKLDVVSSINLTKKNG